MKLKLVHKIDIKPDKIIGETSNLKIHHHNQRYLSDISFELFIVSHLTPSNKLAKGLSTKDTHLIQPK
jgi:hypothetical protein